MTRNDFHSLRDSVVEDELGGAVDEHLGSGHLVGPRLESLTGMKSAKVRGEVF